MGEAPPIERMAQVIGHEIRNPLAVINNSIYFVKTKLGSGVDAKVGKHLGIIEAEVGRANALIAEMLAFARPLQPRPAPCSVAELIANATASAALPAELRLAVAVSPKDLRAMADPELAAAAMRRLLENARDATAGSGEIEVAAARSGDSVEIAVRDSGPGIPDEVADKLFEPFFSTKPRGLGLGLATARKLAEAHGGALERLPSARGAAFALRLPAA